MAEPPDEGALAKVSIPLSEFLQLKEKGTYDNKVKVVLHHTEGSIKVPQRELFPEILKQADLHGGFQNNFHCSTINFVNEKGKNSKKLVIYCKSEEIAKKIISLDVAKLFGHEVKITDHEFERVGLNNEPTVHNSIKKIDVSGFNIHTVEKLIAILREYAEFEDEDILVSREYLKLSITCSKFKKIVPLKRSFSKGAENHTYFIKASGYARDEVRVALADKPKMSDLFENNETSKSTSKMDEWLSSINPIKQKKNPSQVTICNYCGTPGHTRYGPNRKVVCPKLDEDLDKLVCYNCNGTRHTSHTCPKPSQKGEKLCYTCNQPGHFYWQKNLCKEYSEKTSRFSRKNRSQRSRKNISRPQGPRIDLTNENYRELSTPPIREEDLSEPQIIDDSDESSKSLSSDSSTSESESSENEETSVISNKVKVAETPGAAPPQEQEEEKEQLEDEVEQEEDKEAEQEIEQEEEKEADQEMDQSSKSNEQEMEQSSKTATDPIDPTDQEKLLSTPSTQNKPLVQKKPPVAQKVPNPYQPNKEFLASKSQSAKPVSTTDLTKKYGTKTSTRTGAAMIEKVRSEVRGSKEAQSSSDKQNFRMNHINNNRRKMRSSTAAQTSNSKNSAGRNRNKSGQKVTLGDFQKNHQ